VYAFARNPHLFEIMKQLDVPSTGDNGEPAEAPAPARMNPAADVDYWSLVQAIED
jgi:hypothetical protein